MTFLRKITCLFSFGCPDGNKEIVEIDWNDLEEPVKIHVKNQLREIIIRLKMLEQEAQVTVRRYDDV